MSNPGGGGLDVTGGAGGIEVAVGDLRVAAAGMRRAAESVSLATPRESGIEVQTPLAPTVGPDWGLGARALGAPIDIAPLVGRCRRDLADLIADVARATERLRDLADSVSSAAATYEWVEGAARRLVAGVHAQAMGSAWLITRLTGQAFGVLDEGDGWEVALTPTEPRREVPVPHSAESLLAGMDSLGTQGRVRVIELPCADGSTTWVVQVPGTHGGIEGGGEIPMDWPANVSLMLEATSASKVAAATALERAQAGRAGPRDRVVVAGFSQGGIVAAALASDPEFSRRHRVTHVVTAGSPIDEFPVPDSTSVLSLQQRGDPVHVLDVSPPPGRRSWTTVTSSATASGVFRFHDLALYRRVAAQADRSPDVSLRAWRRDLAPALAPAAGSKPVVHEFRSERRWQNRDL